MDEATRNTFQNAVRALKAGNRATAYRLFWQVAQAEPTYQPVWLWLTDTIDNRAQQVEYLRYCIQLDPDSREGLIASRKLARIQHARQPAAAPAILDSDADISPYEDVTPARRDSVEVPGPTVGTCQWIAIAVTILVVMCALCLLLAWVVSLILSSDALLPA